MPVLAPDLRWAEGTKQRLGKSVLGCINEKHSKWSSHLFLLRGVRHPLLQNYCAASCFLISEAENAEVSYLPESEAERNPNPVLIGT